MFEITEPVVYYKSSENMEELKDNSVQLIVTSPPYGKIKDYGSEEQIGFIDTFDDYFKRLKNVWKECYRVLEPQCRMVINVGDQYLRTSDFGRYRILSISSRIIDDCLNIGFDFLGDIVWQKISTTKTTGGCSLMGSIYYPRNGLLTYDYEHILIFKKHEGKERKLDLSRKELSKIPLSEWKKWYVGHWKFPGVVQKQHIAMFPEELPYRIIRMFSFINDTVLDPFVGSGTTLKVAKALFRKGIGYEINKNFKETIDEKTKNGKLGYFQDYQFLVYLILKNAEETDLELNFEKQKQKGIIILKNKKNSEIIIDYLLIDDNEFSKDSLLKEIKSKIDENSVQNYLKEKEGWSDLVNYVIIIKASYFKTDDYIKIVKESIDSYNLKRRLQIVPFDFMVSKKILLKDLF